MARLYRALLRKSRPPTEFLKISQLQEFVDGTAQESSSRGEERETETAEKIEEERSVVRENESSVLFF